MFVRWELREECVCVGKWEVGGEYGGQQKAMERLVWRCHAEGKREGSKGRPLPRSPMSTLPFLSSLI